MGAAASRDGDPSPVDAVERERILMMREDHAPRLTRDEAESFEGWDAERFDVYFEDDELLPTRAEALAVFDSDRESRRPAGVSTLVRWQPGVGACEQPLARGRADDESNEGQRPNERAPS